LRFNCMQTHKGLPLGEALKFVLEQFSFRCILQKATLREA